MNIRRLKKEFGAGVEVRRDRKRRVVTASGAGLSYAVDERRFGGEKELADHLKSKIPIMVMAPQNRDTNFTNQD